MGQSRSQLALLSRDTLSSAPASRPRHSAEDRLSAAEDEEAFSNENSAAQSKKIPLNRHISYQKAVEKGDMFENWRNFMGVTERETTGSRLSYKEALEEAITPVRLSRGGWLSRGSRKETLNVRRSYREAVKDEQKVSGSVAEGSVDSGLPAYSQRSLSSDSCISQNEEYGRSQDGRLRGSRSQDVLCSESPNSLTDGLPRPSGSVSHHTLKGSNSGVFDEQDGGWGEMLDPGSEDVWMIYLGGMLAEIWLQSAQTSVRLPADLQTAQNDTKVSVGSEADEACLWSSHCDNGKELRRSTIPIFFDMMQCEFTQVLLHTKIKNQLAGKFAKFENEMITQLDLQVEGGQGDDEYRQLFTSLIHERCHNHQIMREEGFKFEELVGDLMQRLLEYRTIIRHENKEHRMNCIVNLLNFYRGIDRQEMYIRYLHKLRDLHLESENYTEAAYTLLLYTKLLRWTTDPLEPYLQQTDSQSHSVTQNPHQMTHRELKESLYYTIIEYFDKGKMWEAGIEICRELAAQYEDEIFEYRKLSSILKMQASFLDKIMNDARTSPIYFRVGYYGRGFAPFLSNKAFVYIGREYETITDFKTRIQNQFVDTRLLKTLDEPGEEIKESPHRYLLINRVEPIYESLKRFEGKSVPERVLSYWKHNQMKKFSFSKNLTQSQDVTKLWLEMTNVETDYPLPGILRWFPICSSHSFHVSPIEKAIKTMQDANQRLQAVIEEDSESNPGPTVKTLSMMLTGMVDAKVNLGISNYKVFYNEEYLEGKSPAQKDRENISRLKTCTTQQSVLLTRGLELFGRRAPDNMQPMYKHLMDEFGPFVSLIQQYGMTPPEEVLAMVRIKRSPSTDFLDGSSPAATSSPLLSLNTPDFTSPDIKKLAGLSGTSNSRLSGISSSRLSGGLSLAQLRLPKPGSGAKNHRTNSKVLSEVSTDSSSDNDKAPDTSSSSVIELTQQLTSARPKRPDSRDLLIDDDMPPPLPLKIASVADPSANASFMNSPVSRPRSNNNNGTGSNNGGSNGHYHVLQSQTSASGRESPLQASPLVTPGGVKLRGSSHKGRPPPPLPVKTPMKAPPPIPAKKPGAAS